MLEKELEELVLNEKDIIPFLKKLTPKDKRSLVPFIKKFKVKIFETEKREVKESWGMTFQSLYVHSDKKRNLINMVCYVCFNKTDIKKNFFNINQLSLSEEYERDILPWYMPKWYGDLMNEDIPWSLTYEKMMRLKEQGILNPSHELILNKVTSAIFDQEKEGRRTINVYVPDKLLQFDDTLKEHIWFLFEEVSNINNYYDFLHVKNYSEGNNIWIDTFVYLTNNKKLDRRRLLTATILTSTKGFNKRLSAWFMDLLIRLEPTNGEVLELQDEFFSALNCPDSKVINTVLKYFKTLIGAPKFRYQTFVENTAILLCSETKSVVNSTLMLLDKIASHDRKYRVEVSLKATESLINLDEKVQLRAAKLIVKHGDSNNVELLSQVNIYGDSIFHSVKDVIKAYLKNSNDETLESTIDFEQENIISEAYLIPTYQTLDELIFFVSQALDNNEVFHLDLLMSYLPKLHNLLNEDNVDKLAPLLKRSIKVGFDGDGYGTKHGLLEVLAACYLNDFGLSLVSKFPNNLSHFQNLHKEKLKISVSDEWSAKIYKERLKKVESQTLVDYPYQIFGLLLVKSKYLIEKGLSLDLLSKPTHSPCWIDPVVLIQRIVAYENQNEEINLFDFQIAVGRMPSIESPEKLDEHISKIQNQAIKKALMYHFGFLNIREVKIKFLDIWIQSVLSRSIQEEIEYFESQTNVSLDKERGIFTWHVDLEEHSYDDYDGKSGKKITKKYVRKLIKIPSLETQDLKTVTYIDTVEKLFSKVKKLNTKCGIHHHFQFKESEYGSIYVPPDDSLKFMYYIPNMPSQYLSFLSKRAFYESEAWDEKSLLVNLKGLYETWIHPNHQEADYLFLASALLNKNKESRVLASEIWLKTTNEKIIDNLILGSVLGKLEFKEFAPLKRFTDLIAQNLINVSKFHNKNLLNVLASMFSTMNPVPIKGLKKLLELFHELSHSSPKIKLNDSVMLNLKTWKETKSLKAIITKIEKQL